MLLSLKYQHMNISFEVKQDGGKVPTEIIYT